MTGLKGIGLEEEDLSTTRNPLLITHLNLESPSPELLFMLATTTPLVSIAPPPLVIPPDLTLVEPGVCLVPPIPLVFNFILTLEPSHVLGPIWLLL